MTTIVNVYHIRDPYDHSLGYSQNNIYHEVSDEDLQAIINRQEKYIKNDDIGGYLVTVMTYTVDSDPVFVCHRKTLAQKHKIILNPKARKTNSAKKTAAEVGLAMAPPIEGALIGGNQPQAIFQNFWVNEAQEVAHD